MANKTKAETAANQSPSTEQAAPKPKRENLFSSAIGSDFKKREAKLRLGFNIVGNRIKKLGLSAESTQAIVDILKKEFETQSAGLLKPSTEAAAASTESFV